MALIACPDCAAEVSRSAYSCPKCGYVIRPGFLGRPGLSRALNVIALAVIILIAATWLLTR
jgi:hypothetical protein